MKINKLFPNLSTEGYYNFLNQTIVLNKFEKKGMEFLVSKNVENCQNCRILVMSTIDPLEALLYTFKVEICIDRLI